MTNLSSVARGHGIELRFDTDLGDEYWVVL